MPEIQLTEPTPQPPGAPPAPPPDQTGRSDGLSLRQKLQISFFSFVLLLAMVGYVSYRSINDVDDLVRVILQYDTKHIEISNEIRAKIFRINKNLEAFVYNWQQAPLTAVTNELDSVRRLILRGQDLSNSGQVSRLLSMRDRINWEGLRELVETYQGLFSRLTEDMRAFAALPGSLETTDAMLKLASELETLAVAAIDQAAAGPGPAVGATVACRATELRVATESLASSRAAAQRTRAALDALNAVFKPLAPPPGRPLSEARQKLVAYARLFDEAERRLTRQAQLRGSVEETLAQLARRGAGMEQLTSNLRTQNEAEAESHRAEALELAAHVRSVVGQASVISLLLGLLIAIYIPNRVSMSLDQLLRGARRVGTGDLRWDIEVRDRDELAEVGHNFNLMRRNLAQLAERIQRSALKISTAANTILGTAEREKVAGSEQARSINEISATVTELASSSSELNRNSIKVLDIVSMSSNTSQEGATAISETLGAIQRISESNRLTAEPYTKRMNSFPNVDQGSALLLTSLQLAREAGLTDQCVFPWAGATNTDVAPAARRELGDSPAIRAAASALFSALGLGIDDVDRIDLYSCFPSAVEIGAKAIGLATDDARGLTVTGGMPFFGGPGNNYSSHAIVSLAMHLRESRGLGYVAANGGFLSKHSLGIYGSEPPPGGFRSLDTAREQAEVDAAALPVATEACGDATVVGGTVVYGRDGSVAAAPVIGTLDDGRRVVAMAEPALLSGLSGRSLVGSRVSVAGSPPVYKL